ncbi:MAG: DUF4367 domain-containing protein [Sedimentibacter sp.]
MIKDNNFLEDEFILSKLLISIAEKDTKLFEELEKENIINPKQDELDLQVKKIINEYSNKQQKNRKYKMIRNIITKVAVFLIIVTVGFSVSFVTVDAFRVKVLNFYIEKFQTHTQFMPYQENNSELALSFSVGYMPGGFELDDRLVSEAMVSETYFDIAGNMINVTLHDRDASISVNSENAEQTIVKVNNDETGYIYKRPDMSIMVYKFFGNTIVISSNIVLTVEELLKIAESITR